MPSPTYPPPPTLCTLYPAALRGGLTLEPSTQGTSRAGLGVWSGAVLNQEETLPSSAHICSLTSPHSFTSKGVLALVSARSPTPCDNSTASHWPLTPSIPGLEAVPLLNHCDPLCLSKKRRSPERLVVRKMQDSVPSTVLATGEVLSVGYSFLSVNPMPPLTPFCSASLWGLLHQLPCGSMSLQGQVQL